MKFNSVFLILMAVSQLSACAYRWGYKDRSIPGGYTQLAVPLFNNLTQEVGAELPFTEALILEVERSPIVTHIDRGSTSADLVGKIMLLDYQGMAPIGIGGSTDGRRRNLFTAYQIHATVELKLVRRSDKKVLWKTTVDGVRGYNSPRLTKDTVRHANPLYNKSAREQNLKIIAKNMMNEAFAKMTERF